MKKVINWMLAASVCTAVGLSACTQDKVDPNYQGEPTSVDFVLQFKPNTLPQASDGQTRAATTQDPNGTNAEADVKTVDVFIYTGGGDYLDHKHFQASDFTQGTSTTSADVWQANSPITTTTGPKNFLVGVNLPSAAATSLEHVSMSASSNTVQTIARADININNGLPMFSVNPVAATMQQDPSANRFEAQVKRIVAKVTVEKDPNMTQEGTTGTLGQMTWTINNQNSKYFLAQGAPATYSDPNWTAASYNASDFHDAATPVNTAEWTNVNNGPQTKDTYNAWYALENTSDQKTQKELTRVTIRATFIPSQWVTSYTAGSGTVTRSANSNYPNGSPVDFWTVTPAVGQQTEYFSTKTDADNYAKDKGVQNSLGNPYPGGYCYWNIFLNKPHNGEVYRNDYYKCNITRVVAPGQNSQTLTNPNSPPPTNTTVTAVVDVLYWNAQPMDNQELVP